MSVIAPTGSGKTVLFELAMIKILERAQSSNKPVKCVYVAPTKVRWHLTDKFR